MLAGFDLTWPWNPGVLLFLLLLCLLYILGLRHAVRHSPEARMSMSRVIAFFIAILLIALLLMTPVDTIARTQLFLAHMIQAILLTTLCAPLILFGCSEALLRSVLGVPVVRDITRLLTRPLVASITFNLLFLLWHVPEIYHKTLMNTTLYHVAMLSIFCASLLNWYPLIGSLPELRRMSYPLQMLYAFFDGQPVDILAFILVFSGVVVYPYYRMPAPLGLSAYADQTAGGALLLLPGLVDLVVMSPLFFRWLGQIEQQTKLDDQRRQEQAEQDDELEENEIEETSEA